MAFPLVREADPIRLLAAPPVRGDKLQRYFPRDVDKVLDKALSRPGVVMVVHPTLSGARRTVYEALMRNLPTLPLVTESDEKTWYEAPAEAVLWMDLTDHGRLWSNVQPVVDAISWWHQTGRHAVVLVKPDHQEILKMLDALKPPPAFVEIDNHLSDNEQATAREWFDTEVRTVEELAALSEPVLDAAGRHAAGYHADTAVGVDHLGITADVHMLADVVASRLVQPPLSIGLFGNWGTGKSFFMGQMHARVRYLAERAAEAEQRTGQCGTEISSYCSNVRQIFFNAWHYVEANLWASLATHIFDSLATGGPEEIERRTRELAALRQREQSLLAQLSAVRLERRLVAAQRRVPLTDEDLKSVAQLLGVPEATTAELQRFAQDLQGLGAETRQVWTSFRRSRFALVVCGVGIVLAGALAFLVRTPLWPVLTGVVSLLVAAAPMVSHVRAVTARIRQAADERDQRLAELDKEAERLELAVAELATGHDVTEFARSRHTSEDYRQHLGVVSQLRRDLETFDEMLKQEPDGGLERIVLYIDDLDRCPPDVVVKVLEAVHLLVALPVFVVVVAVDPRWLDRAIRRHYAAMLPDESVTPTHYLEKIFQIPFRLPDMDERGFGSLVQALSGAEPVKSAVLPAMPAAVGEPPTATSAPATEPAQPSAPPTQPPPPVESAAPFELRPRQLAISPGELTFITKLTPMPPTPRAAKRLMNLYRLVRARLSDSELDEFVRGGDFQTVLKLLAMSGEPGSKPPVELSAEAYERWLPLVQRFSFDTRNGPRPEPGAVPR